MKTLRERIELDVPGIRFNERSGGIHGTYDSVVLFAAMLEHRLVDRPESPDRAEVVVFPDKVIIELERDL